MQIEPCMFLSLDQIFQSPALEMAEDLDYRPVFNAPQAIVQAAVSVDPDGTLLLSDDSSFNPERDGADADIGPVPAGPQPVRPGFHPDVRVRLDTYNTELPGDWSINVDAPDPFMVQWRNRARGVYWKRQPHTLRGRRLMAMQRMPGKGPKALTPILRDDIRVIGSAIKDRRISSSGPLIITARKNNTLSKADVRYFLRPENVVEHRMMDALFVAISCIQDVRGPPGYDSGRPYQLDSVALPAITWNHIHRKFRALEGEGLWPFALPEYMRGLIDPSTNEPGDPTNIQRSVMIAHSVLIPILLDADHWMFAYIRYDRKTILVVNTEYEANDAAEKFRRVEKYLHHWCLQNLSGSPHKYPAQWETLHIEGTTLKNVKRKWASGLATVLSALFVVCDVIPQGVIDVPPEDIRAFFAAALSQGGFRGDVYFPHQDAGRTRPWGDLFDINRGFWETLNRPVIEIQYV